MKFPFVYGTILAATLGSLCVVACGSDSSDSGSTAGDAGESSSKAGADSVGGRSSGGATGDSAGDTSATAGDGAVDGGAAGQTSTGGSSTGGAGSSGAGAGGKSSAGSGGGGSTAPVKDGWRCVQVGEACSCVEVTSNPSNTCTLPMTDCCFSFVINGKQNCQCEPTTNVNCTIWLSTVSMGTKVDSCPP